MTGTQNSIGVKPSHNAQVAPDGGKSRAEYNRAHGRAPKAPTKGGPRSDADVLLSSTKRVPAALKKSK